MSRIRLSVAALFAITLGAVATGQDKSRFELKIEKDKAFYQMMRTDVTQIIKVQGQDLTQKQDSTFYFKWTPEKQDGDKWSLKQKIEGLKMNIDISGNPISYDSTKKDQPGAGGNPGLMDFFKNLEGAEFGVTLNTKTWAVEKVDGKDEFVKKLGAGNQQMDSLLKKIMTDDALKQMADPTHNLIPDAAKAQKETWEKKQTLGLGPIGSYEVTYKFTYAGKDATKKHLDRIDVATTLAYKPPTGETEGLLFKIKDGKIESKPLDAGQQSYVLYNGATGRVEEAKIFLKLRGDLTVTIGGTDSKVELDQTQTTTIEGGNETFLKTDAPTPPKKP
ncbi:MAG: DUF6263 family protein [Gemmataceae bacterium]